MKNIMCLFSAFSLIFMLSFDANAKRFGGGKSFGSSPIHQSKQKVTPSTNKSNNSQAQSSSSGASKWLGPLAGIAAGGLLASMFMGEGFNGFQIFDFLIIGLLAFFIFRFITRKKMNSLANSNGYNNYSSQNINIETQTQTQTNLKKPSWFNSEQFIITAKKHFLSLQQYWDENNMDKISEFVTPNMLQSLKIERSGYKEGYQSTYIDNLSAQIDGITDLENQTIVTITFTGFYKTNRFEKGIQFNESWNLERKQGENNPWLIAGIRQN